MRIVVLILLATLASHCQCSQEIGIRFQNKKMYDYGMLREAVAEATSRNAKIILSCEDQTCPFSKAMTKFIKKEMKKVETFDSVMLRVER